MRYLLALLLVLCAVPARADVADARAHYEKATSAYALGHYAEAAAEYEKAFALKPDPALLYNAAQAHRIAGNKQRALLLYQNYLRVFGSQASNRDEVRRLIANLKKAIASDESSASSPPVSPQPLGTSAPLAPAPPPPATTTPPAATTPAPAAAVTTTQPAEKPLIKKPWFWAVVGGAAVLVIAGVTVGAVLGSRPSPPMPSIASVTGN